MKKPTKHKLLVSFPSQIDNLEPNVASKRDDRIEQTQNQVRSNVRRRRREPR